MSEALLPDSPACSTLRAAAAALENAETRGQPFEMSQALAAVGRAYADMHSIASAEACFEGALCWARNAGSTDHVVDLLCELSELAASLATGHEAIAPGAGRAARERARDHVFEASTLACHVADAGWEAKVLLRISDVLSRCGDRQDAVQLQTRALRLMSGSLAGEAPDPALLPGLGRLADG